MNSNNSTMTSNSMVVLAVAWALTFCAVGAGKADEERTLPGWVRVEKARNESIGERHETLRGLFRALGQKTAYGEVPEPKWRGNRSEQQERLYREARDLMISTPGHAEYLGKKIREWKELAETRPEPAYSNYLTNRMYAVQVLSGLPSPETARVMSGFLDDIDIEYEPNGSPWSSRREQ